MLRTGSWLVIAAALSTASVNAQQAKLSAAEIVTKNIQAKGGAQAWHAIQAVTMSGKMQAGGNNRSTVPSPGVRAPEHRAPRLAEQVELPFVMDLKRDRKVRIELDVHGQTAVQIYDGANGWKMRPFLNRTDYEAYTPDEAAAAAQQPNFDGPLMDYAAKGETVELDGTEKVDGRDTYKLKITAKDSHVSHIWIDAQTFLEAKIEGAPRRLDGEIHPVEVYYRDFRQVNAVMFPFELDTKVLPVPGATKKRAEVIAESVVISKVVVNPKLEDSLFVKPGTAVTTTATNVANTDSATRQ